MPLYNAAGVPEPPAGMVERLQQIDPHLDMIFGGESRAWWIVWRWPENDPRRAWIRASKRPAHRDFDMWCKLPADCSADSAYGYLVSHMVANKGHAGIGKMLERVHSYNALQAERNMAPERELAEELLQANSGIRNTPKGRLPSRDGKRLKDFLYDAGLLAPAEASS